jgi:hypothetical protein
MRLITKYTKEVFLRLAHPGNFSCPGGDCRRNSEKEDVTKLQIYQTPLLTGMSLHYSVPAPVVHNRCYLRYISGTSFSHLIRPDGSCKLEDWYSTS